ncbi:MAG: hypothetical protein RIM99_01005 [Cyclobacteriaceae bacterium]
MAEVDIIDLWNKGKKDPSPDNNPDIEAIISKKSRTPLYWIKVVLWIEFWINVISLPFVFLFRHIDFVLYAVIMPIVIVVYLVYYQFLIRKINAFDYTVDVKSGLRRLYNYLNFFFLHYKVIIWSSLIFGYAYGLYQAKQENEFDQSLKFWALTIGLGMVLIGLIGLLFNFLINLIYGRKIKRLRGIVRELEEE